MAYNGQEIFERFGIFVKWFNQLKADSNGLDDLHATAIARFDASTDDRESLVRIGNAVVGQRSQLQTVGTNVVQLVEEYITDDLKKTLNAPVDSMDDLLGALIDAMNAATTPDTVKGNTVSATTPAEGSDNHRSDGTSSTVTTSQMARNDNFIEVTCTSDSTVDGERWTVDGSVTDLAPTEAVTGVPFAWLAAGIESFTINPLPINETGDSSNQLANWSLSGMQLGVNISAEGEIFVAVEKTPASIVESGDTYGQLDNWSISGAALQNTSEGTIFVSLVREPAGYLMTGADTVELANWTLSGVVFGQNTDADGTLYVSVTLSGGTYTISVYEDPQLASKVAEGTTSAALPATVALSEQNTSGITGSVSLNDFTQDAVEIELQVPFHFVRLYGDALREFSPLLAEGVSFTPNPGSAVTLAERNDSGLSGTVELNYGRDDTDIELFVPLHYVRLYQEDPTSLDDSEKASFLVAQGASAAASAAGLQLVEANGSGLTGSVDLTYGSDAGGIVLEVGWRVGDKWTFKTTSNDAGIFQTFFRDQLGVSLPFKTNGTETISDTLAQ